MYALWGRTDLIPALQQYFRSRPEASRAVFSGWLDPVLRYRSLSGTTPLKGAASWLVALLLCLAATSIRFRFAALFDPIPFVPFFPIVAISAVLCGLRQAVLVLGLSVVVAAYFFERAVGQGALSNLTIAIRLTGFIAAGTIYIGAIAIVRSSVRRLENAVRLQESLFRELQHRVANNMQVVAAMLAQTRRAIADPASRDLVERAESRIRSMGDLHRRLYDPRGYEGGLQNLLRDTLSGLFQDSAVSLRLDIDSVALSTDQLTLIVLLVVEAATNAAKHVFGAGLGQDFAVSFKRLGDGRVQLSVSDDGPGLDATAPEANRLGMGIMQSLARQLGGELAVGKGPGAHLAVVFQPEPGGQASPYK